MQIFSVFSALEFSKNAVNIKHSLVVNRFQVIITIISTAILSIALIAFANVYFEDKTKVEEIPKEEKLEIATTPRSVPNILVGKIVAITDGDTAKVLTEDKQLFTIRLAGIDAPERGQDFGTKSKEFLSDLIFDKTVRVTSTKIDKYGRVVGQIYLDEVDVNLKLVQVGLAWHYKKYEAEQTESDRSIYADTEAAAKKKKLGLWISPKPTPPWIFRHPELEAN